MNILTDAWNNIYTFLRRPSAAQIDTELPSVEEQITNLHTVKILVHTSSAAVFNSKVVGAGGLGCELLKNLALSGFMDIHVIDMDTIDVSNLNRQFLFRQADVGKPKATVAAEFITKRTKSIVTPHYATLQSFPHEFFHQFSLVVSGLDSVKARAYLNATLIELASDDVFIPLIDGGTEGLKGQARVILPGVSACFGCGVGLQTEVVTYPLCTIANTPRLPEHCIEYASLIEWPLHSPEQPFDTDSPADISWLFKIAQARAESFGILGVTYALTLGVLKNVIPAIASTNAIVAASCSNEAFKLVTGGTSMQNYMMVTGDRSVYTFTFEMERREDCEVCGIKRIELQFSSSITLAEFITLLCAREDLGLQRPSLRTGDTNLYITAPKVLEVATKVNLEKRMSDLVDNREVVTVTDAGVDGSIEVVVKYE